MFRRQQQQQQQPQQVSTYVLVPDLARLLLEDERREREEVVGRYPFVATSPEVKLADVENGWLLSGLLLGHLAALVELKALEWEEQLRVPPSLVNVLYTAALTKSIRGLMLKTITGARLQ